jgi:hypothetical protein
MNARRQMDLSSWFRLKFAPTLISFAVTLGAMYLLLASNRMTMDMNFRGGFFGFPIVFGGLYLMVGLPSFYASRWIASKARPNG